MTIGLNENFQSPVTPLDPLYVGETGIRFKVNRTLINWARS